MSNLKENFLQGNSGKSIMLIFSNGFQLRGKLLSYDEEVMFIETDQYSKSGAKTIMIHHSYVSTYVPDIK